MAEQTSDDDPIPREVRRALSDGYSFVRGRETAEALSAVTMEELIVEQLLFLDSDQEAQGNTAQSQNTRTVGSWGVGVLQKLDSLEERLLDPDTGAIAAVRGVLRDAAEQKESARQLETQEQ